MEDKGGKDEWKKGIMTREQKMKRLFSKTYKDHKEFLKELVVVQFEDMGINPESVLGNKEEMDEFIRQKKIQLRKIESTSRSQIENEENPDDNDETWNQGQQIPCHISNYRTQIQNVENPDKGQPSTSHISSIRTQIDEEQQTTSHIRSIRTQTENDENPDEGQQTTSKISNTRTKNENEASDAGQKIICQVCTECKYDSDDESIWRSL
ncbi:hypothetical protein NE237_001150 [Protea cynaroides]|uniref:Uncharacterized protein n=1 Tax=Protea cynaroides TaxID=273540 RepID=A0A9Q0KTK8_9MAGN|nr:hypothetical protein NE237_001150 [Protea cynaroides]